jgi:Uncharacterised protein family (UPF0158)
MIPDRRPLDELRGAVARGDGAAVIHALGPLELGDVAQLAGEGLHLALAQEAPGAEDLARRCTATLRERRWEGDDELATLLSASLGEGPESELRPLPIELDELTFILEGDGSSGDGRIDLATGQVWPEFAIDYAEETGEDLGDVHDPERWLYVGCEGSRDGYRDMEDFIAGLEGDRADILSVAITGHGAFRRFRDVIDRWPDDRDRFLCFSEERQRGRARSWLASAGIAAVPGSGQSRPD